MVEIGLQSFDNHWRNRAKQALERKNRLLSFGPNALGLLVTTRHGLFAVDPEDGFVSTALLYHGVYAEPEYKLLESLVSKDSGVLIVGAHIGAHAVPLSKQCRNLIAIEANPRAFTYLQANLRLNQCSNVTAHNIAANDKAERIRFLMNRDNSGGSKRMPLMTDICYVYDDPDIVEIDAMPLDELIETRAFDLILMDIEGSEYFALKGMQEILAESKTLCVEFIPHHLGNIAGVGVSEFLGTILPHFESMYIPICNSVVPKHEIAQKLEAMYQSNECHEGLLFLKKSAAE